jgi:hypothetical protein
VEILGASFDPFVELPSHFRNLATIDLNQDTQDRSG